MMARLAGTGSPGCEVVGTTLQMTLNISFIPFVFFFFCLCTIVPVAKLNCAPLDGEVKRKFHYKHNYILIKLITTGAVSDMN